MYNCDDQSYLHIFHRSSNIWYFIYSLAQKVLLSQRGRAAIWPHHFFSHLSLTRIFLQPSRREIWRRKKYLLSHLRQQSNKYNTTVEVRLKVFRHVTCKLKSWRIFTSESLRPGIFIPSGILCEKKVMVSAKLHQAGAYLGFCSIKRLAVFLLPPGWDASLSQGFPLH